MVMPACAGLYLSGIGYWSASDADEYCPALFCREGVDRIIAEFRLRRAIFMGIGRLVVPGTSVILSRAIFAAKA